MWDLPTVQVNPGWFWRHLLELRRWARGCSRCCSPEAAPGAHSGVAGHQDLPHRLIWAGRDLWVPLCPHPLRGVHRAPRRAAMARGHRALLTARVGSSRLRLGKFRQTQGAGRVIMGITGGQELTPAEPSGARAAADQSGAAGGAGAPRHGAPRTSRGAAPKRCRDRPPPPLGPVTAAFESLRCNSAASGFDFVKGKKKKAHSLAHESDFLLFFFLAPPQNVSFLSCPLRRQQHLPAPWTFGDLRACACLSEIVQNAFSGPFLRRSSPVPGQGSALSTTRWFSSRGSSPSLSRMLILELAASNRFVLA